MRYVSGLLLLFISCAAAAAQLDPYDEPGPTPSVSLEDLGHQHHTLQQYRGKVVLLNFWASWCGPCAKEIPSLERLQRAMKGKPFALLAVNVEESPGTVWKFAGRMHMQFPILLDRKGRTAFDWQVDIYPSSFLIDPKGRIRYVAYGPRNWDAPAMVQTIDTLLKK